MSRLFCCLKNGESIVIVLFSYLTHWLLNKTFVFETITTIRLNCKVRKMIKNTNYFYKITLLFLIYNVI